MYIGFIAYNKEFFFQLLPYFFGNSNNYFLPQELICKVQYMYPRESSPWICFANVSDNAKHNTKAGSGKWDPIENRKIIKRTHPSHCCMFHRNSFYEIVKDRTLVTLVPNSLSNIS